MSDIMEQLAAIKDETAEIIETRLKAFAEFGEQAFAELKDNPAFAEAAAKLKELEEKIKSLAEREAELMAAQEKALKEERESLARRTCVTCKNVNPEDAKFCESCGTKVGELPREYCQACGTMNHPGLKFCGECGAKLPD